MAGRDEETQKNAQVLVLIGIVLIVLGFVGGINEWWGWQATTYVIMGLGILLLIVGCIWSDASPTPPGWS
ncbi:MAG: hypothetical protein AAB613_02340 [Patescibacteria group bacterium]